MGTYYTIITEIINDKEKADNLEKDLIEYNKEDGRLEYQRVTNRNSTYFSIFYKNSGGGFYEWPIISKTENIRCTWIDDEGHTGDYNEKETKYIKCPNCGGTGIVKNGKYSDDCFKCYGYGQIEVED